MMDETPVDDLSDHEVLALTNLDFSAAQQETLSTICLRAIEKTPSMKRNGVS